jgi:carboxypeptidase family protein
MRSRTIGFVLCALALLMASRVDAQITQGRLTGVVTDTQGAVMPGVTVTATSPALIGSQTTVTQPDGKYLFPALPTGTYRLVFDLSGFQKLTRENVQVVLGQTISLDAQLALASIAESVTVTGDSPVIDITTTKVGSDLKGEALVAVPNSTDVWGALSESPGVRMEGFDVGGSHKSQQSGYEVFGITNQARVVSDGVDHTEGVGGTGFYEDYYANEEVTVSGLGSDVEMNSGGAAIATTIKSGGNQFKGLEHLSYEPGGFVGSNAAASDISGRGYTCPNNSSGTPQCDNPNLLFWEGHTDLGGPIYRDRAWFYGAYNHFKIDKAVSGISQSVATDLGIFDNYTGKTTWKPSQNNTLIGYFQQGRKQKPKRGLSTLTPPESVLAQDSTSRMGKGEWQRVFSSRAFLDVNIGSFYLNWPMKPQVDPSVSPPLQFRGDGSRAGAGWLSFSTTRHKPQVKAQMTYYLPEKAGSHDFKFGFENLYDSYRYGHNGNSGPIRYSYAGTNTLRAPDRIIFVDTGVASDFGNTWTVGPNKDLHYAGYAQDRWSPSNRLTITAGVRIDYQRVGYGDAIRVPQIHDQIPVGLDSACKVAPCFIFPASTTVTGQDFLKATNPAPRLGVSYDLSGKGKTVLKVFYGRYYNNLADGFSAANPGDIRQATFNFIDAHGDQRYHGPENLGTLRSRTGGADAPVDPNMKTPYTEEISGSIETQLPGESAVRLTYVRKNQRNTAPFYGTNLIPAWVGMVTVPTRQTFNGQTFNLLDVPDSVADLTDGLYSNFPGDSDFHYDTIELAYNKRLRNFFVQTSFDYQWRDDLRSPCGCNTGDISTSPLSADPIGTNFFFDPNPAVPNRQKTTTYHYQFLGRYTFPYEVGFAANFRYQSGYPYSQIIPDGATSPGLNLSNIGAPFFVQNLDQNRSDNVALLNFRLDKSIPVGRAKVTGMLDIYNVLNADPVTNFNLNAGASYKRVIAVLDPRVFQVGIRLEF